MKVLFLALGIFGLFSCSHLDQIEQENDRHETEILILKRQQDALSRSIKDLKSQIEKLETKETRTPSEYVTLYECNYHWTSSCKFRPKIAGLSSDKCMEVMKKKDAEYKRKRELERKKKEKLSYISSWKCDY